MFCFEVLERTDLFPFVIKITMRPESLHGQLNNVETLELEGRV